MRKSIIKTSHAPTPTGETHHHYAKNNVLSIDTLQKSCQQLNHWRQLGSGAEVRNTCCRVVVRPFYTFKSFALLCLSLPLLLPLPATFYALFTLRVSLSDNISIFSGANKSFERMSIALC